MPPENDYGLKSGKVANSSLSESGRRQSDLEGSFSLIPPSSQGPSSAWAQAGSNDNDNTNTNSEENYHTYLSAQEVFRASLTFKEKLPSIILLPSGTPIDRGTSSSSHSLYPSLESVSQAGNVGSEVEQTWQAARRSSAPQTQVVETQANYGDEVVMVRSLSFAPAEESFRAAAPQGEAYLSCKPSAEESKMEEGDVWGEATAYSSGEMYPGSAYAEATSDTLEYASIPYEQALAEEDDDLIALKRASYYGGYEGGAVSIVDLPEQQAAEATVVECYDVHPSEFVHDSVQAEFVGQDYSEDFAASAVSTPLAAAATVAASTNHVYEVTDEMEEEATEATVIESGPIEKATAEAWSSTAAEEARVLEEDTSNVEIVDLDSKPPAVDSATAWGTSQESDDVAFADEEAEVIGITEEIHPSEMIENTAQAELIGSDFNCAIAVPSDGQQESSVVGDAEEGAVETVTIVTGEDGEVEQGVVEEVTILAEEGSQGVDGLPHSHTEHSEVRATLVVEEHFDDDQGPHSIESATHVAALVEGDYGSEAVSHSTEQATPVATISDANDGNGAVSYSTGPATPVTTIDASYDTGPVSLSKEPPVSAATVISANVEYERTSSRSVSWPPHATATARAVSAPSTIGPFNPFDDDPSDSPAMSRDGLAALDAVTEQEWMRAPSFGGSFEGFVPVAPPEPGTGESETGENDSVPPMPSPCPPIHTASTTSRTRSDGSNSLQTLSNNIARGTNTVMEMLFGETKQANSRRPPVGFDNDSLSGSVLPRALLPSSVIFSQATNSWVATVNTNQKALDSNNVDESSKALRAFSVPTKKQAMCLATAWTPPRMHPFSANPCCFICETKFAVFRRACHCRNCGVCVCSSCSVQWPAKMLPETYNLKKESHVNICKACDWLCSAFRLALLDGDHDKAVALHATDNLNLTTPFANVKGELFYPVHCAVLGGSLKLLSWLVDDHCCPLRSIRVGTPKRRDSSGSYTPVLTSKGRSLLGIGLENKNIGIVRYLVVRKRMLLSAEKNLPIDILMENLDLVLRVLPEGALTEQHIGQEDDMPAYGGFESAVVDASPSVPITPHQHSASTSTIDTFDPSGQGSTELPQDFSTINVRGGNGDEASDGSVDDACIICFSNSIDCVATPCGHQICCLECGNHISRCPVCAGACSFMRVFKP